MAEAQTAENNTRPTQSARVLQYMKDFGSITQYEALKDLGVMRLASRISELRHKRDIDIQSDFVTVRNRYNEKCQIKRYYLADSAFAKQAGANQ